MNLRWKVGKSKIHGNGVFAAEDMPESFDIGVGIVFQRDDKGTVHFHRNTFGLLINESREDPNVKPVKMGADFHFVSLRPIAKDEELVTDYQEYLKKVEMESFITGKRVSVT